MSERKGQKLINYVRFKRLPEQFPDTVHKGIDGIVWYDCSDKEYLAMIEQYIFFMSDEEFNKVLNSTNEAGNA